MLRRLAQREKLDDIVRRALDEELREKLKAERWVGCGMKNAEGGVR